MLQRETCMDIHSATSSPELEDGAGHYSLPDGQQIDLFGLEAVPANPSAQPAKAQALTTSATSGPSGKGSSASAALQQSLESRLQARLQESGSILYNLTWKQWTTPSGLSRSRLRASVLRTSGTERTGWVTASARDWKDTPGMSTEREGGRNRLDQLPRQAQLVGWNTPRATDGSHGGPNHSGGALPADAAKAGWGTPTATPANGEPEAFQERKRRAQDRGIQMGDTITDIQMQAKLAGWPTPSTNNDRIGSVDSAMSMKRQDGSKVQQRLQDFASIAGPARLTVSGQMLTGSSAGMASGGQLCPEHSRWLMGYPTEWGSCADMVTPLSRRKQRSS